MTNWTDRKRGDGNLAALRKFQNAQESADVLRLIEDAAPLWWAENGDGCECGAFDPAGCCDEMKSAREAADELDRMDVPWRGLV